MRFRLHHISRRIVAQITIDALLIALATVAAFTLKYDLGMLTSGSVLRFLTLALPFLIVLRLVCLSAFRLYRIHWRYMSIHDLGLMASAVSLSSIVFGIIAQIVGIGQGNEGVYPLGVQVVDWGVNLFCLSGVRICYRYLSDRSWLAPVSGMVDEKDRQRALIVGAGDAGEAVARDLLRRPQDGIIPIGFADDDPQKRRMLIHGLPVLGTTHDISTVAASYDVDVILIAIPSASGKTIRDILTRCERAQARLCILPSVPEMIDGQAQPMRLREINIEDLLRRAPVRIDMEEIAKYVSGQRVLITGAGGSIGSELCRQICALNPARLLLLGQGENSIFEIEQELVRDFAYAPTTIIADVKDRNRIEEVFLHERPTVVFHAAAHKHVPMMEANPQEAVKNNVGGTLNLAQIAAACGVKKFIYVSTDKAVHPTSVMGATKRIGEMIIQSLAKTTNTEFAAVRFGNVLGSRGSVIPTMRKQIARGGPVTVTDANMTRFFMTIPEAVQLILQAGALGGRGEIFILDMGEPVRILDLARDLIRLSGFRPEHDIKIEFTGIRPGEKIHEALLYDEEAKTRTPHEKIFVSDCNGLDAERVLGSVRRLVRLAQEGERDTLREEIMQVANSGIPHLPLPDTDTPRPAEERLPLA